MDMTEEQVARALEWTHTMQRVSQMTNQELATILTEHVWAFMSLGSPQSDVLAEVIARLESCTCHQNQPS